MKCLFNQEKISAYLDGELPDAERSEVQAHIKACPDCAALLQGLGQTDKVFGEYAECRKTSEYWEKYNKDLERKSMSAKSIGSKMISFRIAAVTLAAGFLTAVLAYYFVYRQPVKEPSIDRAVITVASIDVANSEKILAGSEAALVNLVNLNEDDSVEVSIFQNALIDSALVEQIRVNKVAAASEDLQKHFNKLEAVFTWAQNETDSLEIRALKDVVISNSLIEENRSRRRN